jgi:hypothetical protein
MGMSVQKMVQLWENMMVMWMVLRKEGKKAAP